MTLRSAAFAATRAVLFLGALIHVSTVGAADTTTVALTDAGAHNNVQKAEEVPVNVLARRDQQEERGQDRRRLGASLQVRRFFVWSFVPVA